MSVCFVECWKCDECGHRWIKSETWPDRCASSKCRSRRWNSGDARSVGQTERVPIALTMAGSNPAPASNLEDRKSVAMQAMSDAFMREPPTLDVVDELNEFDNACPYTEYDQDTGETYACGLKVHSAKVRHTRGRAI